MHELSIAISILEVAAEEAERHGLEVVAVRLRLGPLAGVVKEALVSAFEMAREESPWPAARLVIQETPIIVFCPACQAEREVVSTQRICCRVCGVPAPDIRGGRELEVTGLEVKDVPTHAPR
jgi:hydrogenase nickel incorporation protein HypA/HybF